jgi:exonuclease SbcC
MIPVKIKLQGFLSYREPVELDFTGFDLACISGANGAGKSSLLDAITWALFGQARKRDESVINTHPSVDAAEVTLEFAYEGNLYRVQRTNPRGKTSSVEFAVQSQLENGDVRWKTLSERTLRETDRKIEETLRMDFDTFTNASFFLQGKADQFATARPGERKRILSSILGLEIWETYRETASKRRRRMESDVRELDGRLTEVQAELDEGPRRRARLEELEAQLENMARERQTRAENLENVRRLRAALDDRKKSLQRLKDQLAQAEAERDRNLETLEARREEKTGYDEIMAKEAAIEKAYESWQEAREALEAMDEVEETFRQFEARRHDPLSIIREARARLEQEKDHLLEQKTELEKALSDAEALEADLAEARKEVAEAQEQLTQREALEAEIRQLQKDQAEAKAENPRLREEMHELKDRIDQLAAAEGVECPLCGQPLSSDERQMLIDHLAEKGKTLGDRFRDNKQLLDTFENQLKSLGGRLADLSAVDAALREATRQADQLEGQLETLRQREKAWKETGARRLAEIETALEEAAFAQEARTRLAAIDEELEALGYDLEAHEKLRQTERSGRDAEADLRALEQARAALAPIEREIARLEEEAEAKEARLCELAEAHDEEAADFAAKAAEMPDVDQAESDLIDLQEQENRLRMEVGAARQKVAVLDTLKQRRENLLEERDGINHQIADLKRLERAFGKDGIPALLIEQALPEIEENTNELLTRLTNGRMSFSFLTQREYKDAQREDLKETLDIVISDNMGERDYEMFSGGEAFRVNFSIRLALSRVLARRAGARLQTLVIDEGFGSQDEQGRQRLVEAINMVRDDFEKILVITHLESLKEAFPTRIEVEKTEQGSQVQVIT